LFLFAEKTI